MGRNFHSAKNYQWDRKPGDTITCWDAENCLFHIFDEGAENNMLNAYMKGVTDGERRGRAKLQHELHQLLNVSADKCTD